MPQLYEKNSLFIRFKCPYDSYSPVEPAPVGGLVVVYDDPSGNNDGVYSLDPVEPAPVGGLVVVYDDPSV
jgi:hypothetical protein